MMKLKNVARLIFGEIKKKDIRYTTLSEVLDIYPQNLTMWEQEMNIPTAHLAELRRELGISKQRMVKALREDFEEALK